MGNLRVTADGVEVLSSPTAGNVRVTADGGEVLLTSHTGNFKLTADGIEVLIKPGALPLGCVVPQVAAAPSGGGCTPPTPTAV